MFRTTLAYLQNLASIKSRRASQSSSKFTFCFQFLAFNFHRGALSTQSFEREFRMREVLSSARCSFRCSFRCSVGRPTPSSRFSVTILFLTSFQRADTSRDVQTTAFFLRRHIFLLLDAVQLRRRSAAFLTQSSEACFFTFDHQPCMCIFSDCIYILT